MDLLDSGQRIFRRLLLGQARPTGTEYHTVYLSADGTQIYGESSLETSTMNIPPGTTIVHTATAAFSMQAGSGTKTNFSAVQSGGPQQSLDPVELGDIPWGPDVLYTQVLSDTAVCNYFGNFFDDSSAIVFTPPPVITGLQDFYNGQYLPFAPLIDTPQSANQTLVIYGKDLTAAGLSNPPTICINSAGCSAGGAISVSGFHLGSTWYVTDSQINIPFWIDAAAIATTYTISVSTRGGLSQSSFFVGDGTPVITGMSSTNFVAGVAASAQIYGQHFGTNVPQVSLSTGGTVQVTNPTDTTVGITVTPAAAGAGTFTITAEGYNGNPFVAQAGSRQTTNSPQVVVAPQCPQSVYVAGITPLPLANAFPAVFTGVGIVSAMGVGPGPEPVFFDGAQIGESLTQISNSCPASFGNQCENQGGFSIFTVGPANGDTFLGTRYAGPTVGQFLDFHVTTSVGDVLGGTGVVSCTVACAQTYSCGGRQIGAFTVSELSRSEQSMDLL